jgi:chemotaxis protein MotB
VSAGEEETQANELVIIRRNTNGEEAPHKGGVWKIAYADFMTAMMAFFLVMWLINATDKQTLTQVATYFNPMRLTDKVPMARGLHQPESGAPTSESATGGPKPQAGPAKADSKGETKGEGSKPTQSEEMLFRDPYAALSKLAAKGEAEQRRAEAAVQRRGEAYRDPFEPAFRRGAGGDKSQADNREAADPQIDKPQVDKSQVDKAEADKPRADKPQGDQSQTAMAQPQPTAPSTEPGAASPPAMTPLAGPPSKEGEAQARKAEEAAAQQAAAAQIEAQIKEALARSVSGALPGIDVKATDEGVLISLTDQYDFGMFAIASAEPRPAMVVVMDKLAKVLAGQPERLIVRGHTDGRPYKSGTYDNWRLSSARAHMAYYMLVRGGIDEKRIERVEGHADRSLRIPGDPEAAQNRRIEILLRKGKP